MEQDVFPEIGHFAIGEINGVAVLEAIRKIEARGAIETAKRDRGYILAVLGRAHAEGRTSADEVHSVELTAAALKPAPPVNPQPALLRLGELRDLQK